MWYLPEASDPACWTIFLEWLMYIINRSQIMRAYGLVLPTNRKLNFAEGIHLIHAWVMVYLLYDFKKIKGGKWPRWFMETDFKKMCPILEIWEKQQFLFVLSPVCFALAKPYPFPPNAFSPAYLLFLRKPAEYKFRSFVDIKIVRTGQFVLKKLKIYLWREIASPCFSKAAVSGR